MGHLPPTSIFPQTGELVCQAPPPPLSFPPGESSLLPPFRHDRYSPLPPFQGIDVTWGPFMYCTTEEKCLKYDGSV